MVTSFFKHSSNILQNILFCISIQLEMDESSQRWANNGIFLETIPLNPLLYISDIVLPCPLYIILPISNKYKQTLIRFSPAIILLTADVIKPLPSNHMASFNFATPTIHDPVSQILIRSTPETSLFTFNHALPHPLFMILSAKYWLDPPLKSVYLHLIIKPLQSHALPHPLFMTLSDPALLYSKNITCQKQMGFKCHFVLILMKICWHRLTIYHYMTFSWG